MRLNLTLTWESPNSLRERLWSLRRLVFNLAFLSATFCVLLPASGKWVEFNLGPFYVDTDADPAAARSALNQLEQVRWVMGGLLEIKELNATWPFRLLLTTTAAATPSFSIQNGYYLLVLPPDSPLPLGKVAGVFLDSNTPRLPETIEAGIVELFSTLKANGSRVSWGGQPANADLAFARLQLFATKFDYQASFHIFLRSLRNGSTVRAAEKNAFGQDPDLLERQAEARLAANNWTAVSISGRPLDPKRDFGEHPIDSSVALAFCASALASFSTNAAEMPLRQALNEGGKAQVLALDSMAKVAQAKGEKPDPYYQDAIHAGSKDAAIYLDFAASQPPDQALPLLKQAELLNPIWAAPIYQQALITDDPATREELLKKALQLDPRMTDAWVSLAQTQSSRQEEISARSSWTRAEDSAPEGSLREAIQKKREADENTRLDTAESEEKQARERAVLDDRRAQQAEQDRIHAAESRANQTSANLSQGLAAGSSAPDAVDWDSLVKARKISGHVTAINCHGKQMQISIRDTQGITRLFAYQASAEPVLVCGAPPDKRSLTIVYRPQDRAQTGTDGEIVSLAWR